MVVRSKGSDTEDLISCYPVVETIQTDNICDIVICPAQISSSIAEKAINIAKNAVSTLSGWGIFGVEMFLLANGEILLNEIAPRSLLFILFHFILLFILIYFIIYFNFYSYF